MPEKCERCRSGSVVAVATSRKQGDTRCMLVCGRCRRNLQKTANWCLDVWPGRELEEENERFYEGVEDVCAGG